MFSGIAPAHLPWAEDLIRGLCASQINDGHEVTILSTTAGEADAATIRRSRQHNLHGLVVEQHPLDRWTFLAPKGSLLRRFNLSSALTKRLKELVPSVDIVHIHTVFPHSSATAARIAYTARVPYVISPYGNLDPYVQARHSPLVKAIYLRYVGKPVLNRAAAIHAISGGEMAMIATYKLASAVRVVNLGVDVNLYDRRPQGAFRLRHPEIRDKKLILYVGRISFSKGLDFLASAFRQVCSERGDCHLVLVGPDFEGYRPIVEKALGTAVVTSAVTFVGRVSQDEKIDAMSDADVFVFPSYTEAFGLAMLEAMACGAPVFVSDRAALGPELSNLGAAMTAPVDDVRVFADKLMAFLDDEAGRRVVASTGYRLIRDRFSWPVVSRQFRDLYEEALDLSQRERR